MLKRAKRLSDYVGKVSSIGAMVCVCALVVLVSYSAISRYIFSRPIHFMEEVGGLLLMAIAFLSFAYVFNLGRHIKITIITDKLPKVVRNWMEVAASLVSLAYLIIFIKLSCDFVYRSYQLNCHTVNANLYAVPWMALMPAGIIILTISVLIFCIDKAYSTAAKMEEKEGEGVEKVMLDKTI